MTSSPGKSRSSKKKRRVFIVDDHPVVRDGVATLVNKQPDLTVCGEAEGAPETMNALVRIEADIVIVDVSLKDIDGLELIRNLKAVKPSLPVLVLSAHDESRYAERCIRAGALGYVMKSQQKGSLLEGIRQVLEGKVYLSEEATSRILANLSPNATRVGARPEDLLSDRELEVLRLTGHGLTTGETAERMRISAKTVQRHRDKIRGKLDLANTTKLQFFAFKWVQDHKA